MKTIIISFILIMNVYAIQNSSSYNWNAFIKKALDASFILKQEDAQINLEKGKVASSTLWVNPDFEIAYDDEFQDSIQYTFLQLSQKLPAWGEMGYKKSSAKAGLKRAKHTKEATVLSVQYQAASLFAKIIFLQSQLDTLNQQLSKVKYLQKIAVIRENSGDMSALERIRIDIMKQQIVMKKQRLKNTYFKVQFEAQTLLNTQDYILITGDIIKPKELEVDSLISSLQNSPKYLSYNSSVDIAKQELALTKSTRYLQPELYLYQERSNNNNQTQNISGFGLRFSLPIWDRQNAQIEIKNAQIQKNSIKSQEILYRLQREVHIYNKLYKDSLLQSNIYKNNLLIPTKRFYEISRLSYEAGEKNLLELLDAQKLYFQSQIEHNTLISQSNLYWLQLCSVASINLLKDNL